ncbi:MAG: hypothetical protein KGL63_10085, partial [Betaproteobacteria bacterium]|nr:hypothetical protein [Betaproteobacteria bacterium]
AKAFDSVNHQKLFTILSRIGVQGKCLNMIQKIYQNSFFSVLDSGKTFKIEKGVRQGDPLSPILFSLYINGLSNQIAKGNLDLYKTSTGYAIPALLYADDIALISKSIQTRNIMMRNLIDFLETRELNINSKKCGHLTIRDKVEIGKSDVYGIPEVDEYKYLGLIINNKFDYTRMFEDRLTKSETKLAMCLRFLRNPNTFLAARRVIIKCILIPTLTYGMEIWGWNTENAKRCEWEIQNYCHFAANLSPTGSPQLARIIAMQDSFEYMLGNTSIRILIKAINSKTYLKYIILDMKTNPEAVTIKMHQLISQYITWRIYPTEDMLRDKGYLDFKSSQWKQAMDIQDIQKMKIIKKKFNKTAWDRFERFEGWKTRSTFFELENNNPLLTRGFKVLTKMRISNWFGTNRFNNLLQCDNCGIARKDSALHWILTCSRWNWERSQVFGV